MLFLVINFACFVNIAPGQRYTLPQSVRGGQLLFPHISFSVVIFDGTVVAGITRRVEGAGNERTIWHELIVRGIVGEARWLKPRRVGRHPARLSETVPIGVIGPP